MSEWVCIVRVETDDDPGAELYRMIKDRFGDNGDTTTTLAFVYDDVRDEMKKLRGIRPARSGFVAEHEYRGLKGKYGR